MQLFTLRSLKQRLRHRRKYFFKVLNRIEKDPPRNFQSITQEAAGKAWEEVQCISCANCCKVMTPTYSNSDIKRIAAYLQMPVIEFKKRWLKKERGTGSWVNKSTPCQFLDLHTNLCGVYEVRPADCAGFPHLNKRKMIDFMPTHKQNMNECPATYKMVEKIDELIKKGIEGESR